MQTLERHVAERVKSESDTERGFRRRREDEERAYQANRQRVTATARQDTTDTKAKYQSVLDEVNSQADTETKTLETSYAEVKKSIVAKVNSAKIAAKKKAEEAKWQSLALFEAGKDAVLKQYKEHEQEIKKAAEQVQTIKVEAGPALPAQRFAPASAAPETSPELPAQPLEALQSLLENADALRQPVEKLLLPELSRPPCSSGRSSSWPAFWRSSCTRRWAGAWCGGGRGRGAGGGCRRVLWTGGRRSEASCAGLSAFPQRHCRGRPSHRSRAGVGEGRPGAREATRRGTTPEGVGQRRSQVRSIARRTRPPPRRRARRSRYDLPPRDRGRRRSAGRRAEGSQRVLPRRLQEIQDRFQREITALEDAYKTTTATTERLYNEAWQTLTNRWCAGPGRGRGRCQGGSRNGPTSVHRLAHRRHRQVPARAVAPDGIKFGTLTLDLADIPNGLPKDPRLKDYGPTRHELPALLPFPRKASVLIKTGETGRDQATSLLQSLMLRFLTAVPPGKVRFTIIDPVGLGENFAAFMHLADYDELLVTSRIWTETPQIEQRLADLTAHMENVIQKYLRNEYATIEEYNARPARWPSRTGSWSSPTSPSTSATQAVAGWSSIASSGARCGVYTLIVARHEASRCRTGLQLEDLEPHCVNLTWSGGTFIWNDADFGDSRSTLDAAAGRESVSRPDAPASASGQATPSASRCPSSSSLPPG